MAKPEPTKSDLRRVLQSLLARGANPLAATGKLDSDDLLRLVRKILRNTTGETAKVPVALLDEMALWVAERILDEDSP